MRAQNVAILCERAESSAVLGYYMLLGLASFASKLMFGQNIDVFRQCVLLSHDGVLSITEPLNYVLEVNIPRSIIIYSTVLSG